MSAASAGGTGGHQRAAAVLAVAAIVGMTLAPLAALATGENETESAAGEPSTSQEDVERSASRETAERRLRARGYSDDEADGPGASMGFRSMLSGRSGLMGTAGLAFAFYFLFMRGRGGAGSATSGWGSYYLFWIVAPVLLAAGLVAPRRFSSSSSSAWSRAAGCPIRSCSSSTRAASGRCRRTSTPTQPM